MYPEYAQKRYVADLEAEAGTTLENISEAAELLAKDLWHGDAYAQLEANVKLLRELRTEISRVADTDPDEWWAKVKA